MKLRRIAGLIVCAGLLCVRLACAAPDASPAPVADPWPRALSVAGADVLVYQPQINSWNGNQIDFRAALAIKPAGAANETYGVVFATARTQVDKVARRVTFDNLQITRRDFPTLANNGAAYAAELQKRLAGGLRTISLDRLEASLAASGIKPSPVGVDNTPPRVIVSTTPAILVPVDGAPVLKPVADHPRLQRVINTRALIVKDGFRDGYYLHVYDGWLVADTLDGPWAQAFLGPFSGGELDDAAAQLGKTGAVDLLDGGPNANPKPSLADGVPTIYAVTAPAELVVFKGQPDFVPIAGTQLLWATNTTNDALIDTTTNDYYLLLAGRCSARRDGRAPGRSFPVRRCRPIFRASRPMVAQRRCCRRSPERRRRARR